MHCVLYSIFTGALLLLWSFVPLKLQASPPGWQVDPASYSNSMVMVGALNFHRVESVDENDMVAAFINGECRGVVKPVYEEDVDRYLAYLLIYANETDADINFKLYDADADQVFDVPKTLEFEVNGIKGELERPYVWSSVRLREEAVLYSFAIPEQVSGRVFDEQEVSISMRLGTDLTALIPDFKASNGATVWVNGEQQISSVSTHDFTQPVTYTVRSEDEQTFEEYTVQVHTTESRIGATLDAVNAITPNGDGVNDYWVIRNIEDFKGFELSVYNAAGEPLYHSYNYQNGWDGTSQGRALSEGTYYYVFVKDEMSYRGIITILK